MWKDLLALAVIYPHLLLASHDSNLHLLGRSTAAIGPRSYDEWANSTDLICKPAESPFFSSPPNLVYKYDKFIPPATLTPFRDGFYKSTCFANPIDDQPEEYCIFINPTINEGQGMVIVTPTELFENSLNDGLKLSDDPPDQPESLNVVPMPEKGGMGALAARDLQRGDPVQRTRPVALVAAAQPIWATRFGRSIRRQAIDHLPLQTRAAIASLHGLGETEDEFVSSVIEANMFATKLYGDEESHFGALVLQGS
jgi:hypothetical protein